MRIANPLILAAVALASCRSEVEHFSPIGEQELVVRTDDFQSRLSLSGSLAAEESATINTPGDAYGLVIRWMADDGSFVKKGDKVLEMDTTAVVSQIEALKSKVIGANNALAQQHSDNQINRAEKEHLLKQAAFALKKAELDANVPADAYPARVHEDMQLALGRAKAAHIGAVEALASEAKIAKNSLEQKRIEFERAKRELEQVYETLDSYVLHAPRDGVLIASTNWQEGRAYRVGDKTWPGAAVVELPDFSAMVIEAEMSDVDDGRIHVGMRAECYLDAYPEEVLTGTVTSISPVARKARKNSLRQIFDVTVKLDETDSERMRPGMSARVEIASIAKKNVLLAPRAALDFAEDGVRARLGSGELVDVVLGPCNAHECVVESGLENGSKLRSRGPL